MSAQMNIEDRRHSHTFGQDRKRPGEARTIIVIAITGTMMAVEIAAGVVYGSMALLADGLHMASHAAALSINALAYAYCRRHADDPSYSFGTGKINALGGFTGAVLLAVFALVMAWESAARLLNPVDIAYEQAILVAVLGLVVNGASVAVLTFGNGRASADLDHGTGEHHHDHNLRAAYLHVLADSLTSLLAIFALLAAKYAGLGWMDPAMGIVGACLVSRWSLGLMRDSSGVLLDRQGSEEMLRQVRGSIEGCGGDLVTDLHLWSIGPGIRAAALTIVSDSPKPPDHYKELIPAGLGLVHMTVEVQPAGRSREDEEKKSRTWGLRTVSMGSDGTPERGRVKSG